MARLSSCFIWRRMTFVPVLCHLHMLPVAIYIAPRSGRTRHAHAYIWAAGAIRMQELDVTLLNPCIRELAG